MADRFAEYFQSDGAPVSQFGCDESVPDSGAGRKQDRFPDPGGDPT